MAEFTINKIRLLFFFCVILQTALCSASSSSSTTPSPSPSPSSKETLVQSESKDPGKLEIIKQIKKVNDDGSYTIGYEADDGSFKIESRDVLGNIKGTYGYIDDAGEIKRVSYSTSNSSEVLNNQKPESSVVQRIPKNNRTSIYTTRRPYYSTTRINKLRGSQSTTTPKSPNYSEIVNMDSEMAKTTIKPSHLVYASSTPRVLRPTPAPHAQTQTQKSEGQLIRPEVVATSTELPLFRRLALKHSILSTDKPVTEEVVPERSNILRRQLSQEKSNFDPQQHVFTLQQSLGSDSTDVYSASVTTGTPRPLFTTTLRPRALLSSTTAPNIVTRPTIRYPPNYQRNVLQDLDGNTQEYVQESTTSTTTTEAANEVTSTPVPVVQIPANREPLVAIKHPFQRGTILVPLSQIQQQQQQHQQNAETHNQQPIYVRRLPPPQFRPIPVQVDENGYIRDIPQNPEGPITPYPLPIPVTPQKYQNVNNDDDNNNNIDSDIDQISPPVSTRDFQKLLQQLIVRQTRLEKISELTNPRRHPEFYQNRYRTVYRPAPYYMQRAPEIAQQRGPVQFIHAQEQNRRLNYAQAQSRTHEADLYEDNVQSYAPTRRVARLLPNEEYLPPDVREMLLLRMLQLAINPALPLHEDDFVDAGPTTVTPQYKKLPVRNVEILGEEEEEDKRDMVVRSKRYRERYYE